MDKAISVARDEAYDKADSGQHNKWNWSCPSCLLVGIASEIVYEVHIVLEGNQAHWAGTFQVDVENGNIVGMLVHSNKLLDSSNRLGAFTEKKVQLSAEDATTQAASAIRRLSGSSEEETNCDFQTCKLLQQRGQLIYEIKLRLSQRQTRWNKKWEYLWAGTVNVDAMTGQVVGVVQTLVD